MNLTLNSHELIRRFGLEKAAEICKNAGFDSIDYSLGCMEQPEDIFNNEKEYRKAAEELRKAVDATGLPVTQTHTPFVYAGWKDPKVYEEFIMPSIRRSIEISAILGVEALDVEEMVAYVACNGTCGVSELRYEYQGPRSCIAANLHYSGSKLCKDACLGYGDCAAACPKDAIYIEDGVARVDSSKCIGCGICVRTCPNAIIKLIPEVAQVTVNCSNHDKGALTRKYCANGCIGCMKCEKTCPSGAIKVQNNVATIDYSLCTSCKECVKVCPVKCIHEGCFIGTTHND